MSRSVVLSGNCLINLWTGECMVADYIGVVSRFQLRNLGSGHKEVLRLTGHEAGNRCLTFFVCLSSRSVETAFCAVKPPVKAYLLT